jgi:hypothetical protein
MTLGLYKFAAFSPPWRQTLWLSWSLRNKTILISRLYGDNVSSDPGIKLKLLIYTM